MNLLLATDSYKLTHFNQYPAGTTGVYSYLESRAGAEYKETVFFGLQYLLKQYLFSDTPNGVSGVFSAADIEEVAQLAELHLGDRQLFNEAGWKRLLKKHGGRLPVRIKAVAEGTPVHSGNVLMTVENTDPDAFWLTNYLETLLSHVWYPSTVATLSREIKKICSRFLDMTADSSAGLPFMLHDFGYRGATSEEAAGVGGMAHLVNFSGTDTLAALRYAHEFYGADYASLAFSIPATEHSVMTALGREGELAQLDRVLDAYPGGLVSIVSDSYNIYNFVDAIGSRASAIKARNGKLVVRPDSVTQQHKTPDALVVDLAERLWITFGGNTNSKGFRVLDPHIGLIWGDGINATDVDAILAELSVNGFSAENIVFGMGGGLLQKVNRDTQRFAFKCSAQQRDGEWHPVSKDPVGGTKTSKPGRLKLIADSQEGFLTTREELGPNKPDLMETVFEDGVLMREQSFADVRDRAAL